MFWIIIVLTTFTEKLHSAIDKRSVTLWKSAYQQQSTKLLYFKLDNVTLSILSNEHIDLEYVYLNKVLTCLKCSQRNVTITFCFIYVMGMILIFPDINPKILENVIKIHSFIGSSYFSECRKINYRLFCIVWNNALRVFFKHALKSELTEMDVCVKFTASLLLRKFHNFKS